MHVLIDETNSLIENDAQDKEFELGLARKDLLLMHEKSKSRENGSGPGSCFFRRWERFESIRGKHC